MLEEFFHPGLIFWRQRVSDSNSAAEQRGQLAFECVVNRVDSQIGVGYPLPLVRFDGEGAEQRVNRGEGHSERAKTSD